MPRDHSVGEKAPRDRGSPPVLFTILNAIPHSADRAKLSTFAPSRRPDSQRAPGSIALVSWKPDNSPCAKRGAPHRFRQRDDGDPLRSSNGAEEPPRLRYHQGQGFGAARLRRLAPLPAIHSSARGIIDRHDNGPRLWLREEERDRYPPGDRC